MRVEELIGEKSKAEKEIAFYISKAIEEFSQQTGIGVKAISIEMVDITTLEESYQISHHYKVSEVELALDL